MFATTNFTGEKNNENEQDGFSWTRSEYVEYVAEQIEKVPVVSKFLESFPF